MEALISVLMPVYNVAPYVAEAIESILRQTYRNFEFVIVDDCSTDGTFDICKKYAGQDSRIVLLHNEQNLKIEGTLNKGLEHCHGKYVVRMDGDDISLPDRFERMKAYLDEHPDVSMVGTSVENIDADGKFLGRTVYPDNWELIQASCTLKIPLGHIWMTYKWVYEKLHGYRKLFGTEDWDFLLRFLTEGYKCTNISDYFGNKMRLNRAGDSGSVFGAKKLKSKAYVVKLYKERLKTGKDSYDLQAAEKYVRSSAFAQRLYFLSSTFLYKAFDCRATKKYVGMVCFLLCSLISPLQARYLYEAMKYRLIARKQK